MNRFLSNFYPAVIIYDGITYPTVEHAYQASKTLNMSVRRDISQLPTPGGAKRAGRRLILRPGWDDMKIGVMDIILHRKFEIPHLRQSLLDTGNAYLIEGNTWGDTYWGVCNERGQNHLGKLLMKIRAELAQEV